MSEIELELQKAAGVKRKSKDSEEVYLKKLIDAVQELPDDQWDQISKAAQEWVNAGSTALNKNEDIPNFPDAEKEEEVAEKDVEEEKDEADTKTDKEEVVAKGAKKGKAEKKAKPEKKAKVKVAAAKKEKKEKVAKPRKERKAGAQVAIKKFVIKNPTMSTEDLVSKLNGAGTKVTLSAVSTIKSGTLQTMRLIKELGMPKGDF